MNKRTCGVLILLGITPFLLNGYINSLIYTTPVFYWSFEIISWILIPTVILYIAINHAKMRIAEIGISSHIFGRKSLFLVFLASVIFCPINLWLYQELFGYFRTIFPDEGYFQYKSVVPDTPWLKVLVAIYFGLTAGIIEEIYYRGFIYKYSLYFRHPIVIYYIISPLAFAAVHWESGLANVFATYIFGIFGVTVFLIMKNIWPLIIGHIYTDYIWYS